MITETEKGIVPKEFRRCPDVLMSQFTLLRCHLDFLLFKNTDMPITPSLSGTASTLKQQDGGGGPRFDSSVCKVHSLSKKKKEHGHDFLL